jgi:hypothetical protein
VKLGAAPEIDRHTLQLSEPPPRHGRQSARHELSWSETAVQAAQIALVMRMHSQCIARARARRFIYDHESSRDARTDGHGGAVAH